MIELQDRACLLDTLERFKAGAGDFVLILRVIRHATGVTQWVVSEDRAGRICSFHDIERGTHAEGWDTNGFEVACDQTHGLMADGSQRYQKRQIDTLSFEALDNAGD